MASVSASRAARLRRAISSIGGWLVIVVSFITASLYSKPRADNQYSRL